MPPQDRDLAYLWDMRQAAQLVAEFTRGSNYARYSQDKMLQSAVERQLEIIGEAASHVSPEFRQAHSQIPWRQIVGLRNILIHDYGAVKIERVWLVARENIPELLAELDQIIQSPDEN